MVKIHGSLWAITGIFIWGYSVFIERKAEAMGSPTSLVFFKWLAIAFLIWGAIRITTSLLIKRKEKEKVGPPIKHHVQEHHNSGSPHQTHQHVRHPHGSAHRTHEHTKPHGHPSHHAAHHAMRRCPSCHHPIHQQVRLCPFCKKYI